jgi:hypothetical protein
MKRAHTNQELLYQISKNKSKISKFFTNKQMKTI